MPILNLVHNFRLRGNCALLAAEIIGVGLAKGLAALFLQSRYFCNPGIFEINSTILDFFRFRD